MSIFRDFFNVKQKPVFTGSRFGFGSGPSGPTGPFGPPGGAASGAFVCWGGGGAGGEEGSIGGGGGCANGTLALAQGTYTFVVGSTGTAHSPSSGQNAATIGGGSCRAGNGGGGGGFTGLFSGDHTPCPFLGYDSSHNASPAPQRDNAHGNSILIAGGGGGCGQEPTTNNGGGGGGGTSGDAGQGPNSPTKGGGGTQNSAGNNASSIAPNALAGGKLLGGWSGGTNNGGGGGGGGFYGGGCGGHAPGDTPESAGGGSGHIAPPYGTATLTTGDPGRLPTSGGAASQPNPYYPGSAGQGGTGMPSSGGTPGAFVIGSHSGGFIFVTPPGGAKARVPYAGQAFNNVGIYLLEVE